MDISRSRQELRRLFIRQMELQWIFLRIRALVKGGIYKTRLKCGKPGCRCEKGKKHGVWMFYRSEGGKTRIRTLSEKDVHDYGHYTRDYQRYRRARAELVKLQREQLRLIDLLEDGLRRGKRNVERILFRKVR